MSPGLASATAGFTYQGQLTLHGSPVNATCSMQFRLFDTGTGGSLLGTIGPRDINVNGGVFTTLLDFDADKLGEGSRWLEISVDCGTGLIQLSPRQEITAAPYAILSHSVAANTIDKDQLVDGAVDDSKLAAQAVTNSKLAAQAVTNDKLAGGAVDARVLSDSSVTGQKIAPGAVGANQINSNEVQRRVSGTCQGGSFATGVSAAGQINCQNPAIQGAQAYVSANGFANVQAGEARITVTKVGTGRYCISAPPLLGNFSQMLATLAGHESSAPGFIQTNTSIFSSACNPHGGYGVFTFNSSGNPVDRAFHLVIFRNT